ncbi:hypothetical protein B0T18DRAFT_3165 [Schizothecium vesticola]|uniref:Uncharacterized protein n=1 Tax=Schizothecium vesticola TaxID=314040 RepID=A0AA40F825_9PEZI|nr:hypothetical protein B0T18DRAFT_3165 [Schizothecium vesticola]
MASIRTYASSLAHFNQLSGSSASCSPSLDSTAQFCQLTAISRPFPFTDTTPILNTAPVTSQPITSAALSQRHALLSPHSAEEASPSRTPISETF